MLQGKFGVFFKCMKCGNINLRKVMEFNTINPKPKAEKNYIQKTSSAKKTVTVRSDDPRYFD